MRDSGPPPQQSDRRARIIRLLETRDQLLENTRRSHIGSGVNSGFRHDTRAPTVCPVCEGCESANCTGCGGRGSIEVQRARDPYAVNDVKAYGLTGAQHDRGYALDAEIDRLRQQTREPFASPEDELADANRRDYGWCEARKRMWRQFDYAALDLALEALRRVDDDGYRLLHEVYVYGWLPEPAEGSRPLVIVNDALTFVGQLMRDPIRAPGPEQPPRVQAPLVRGAGRRLFGARDARIRRRVLEDGEPTVAVTVSEGLSVSQVNRIIAKGDTA